LSAYFASETSELHGIRGAIAPSIFPSVVAARRALPLRLARQPLAEKRAIGARVEPGDAHHRLLCAAETRLGTGVKAARHVVAIGFAGAGTDALQVLCIRHFGLVQQEAG